MDSHTHRDRPDTPAWMEEIDMDHLDRRDNSAAFPVPLDSWDIPAADRAYSQDTEHMDHRHRMADSLDTLDRDRRDMAAQ